MGKNKFTVGLLLVVLFCGVALGTVAEAQSGGKIIIDIQIHGNYSVSSDTVLNKLKIKIGDTFEEIALNKELKRLYAMGYFTDVSIELEDHPEGVVIIFNVVEKPIITEVEFSGNSHIKASKLLKRIKTKEGDLLDFNQVSQDVSEIRSYYTDEGYYQIKVDYKIEASETGEYAKLIFLVDEGRSVKVKEVSFEGNMTFTDKELEKLMSTKTAWWFIRKGVFDENDFEADLARIETFYRTKGFLDVKVSSRTDYSDDGKTLFITVIVDESERYYVGDITFWGNLVFDEEEVRDRIIMRQGDPFDYEMMKEDLESVRMLYYDDGYMNADVDIQHKYNPATGAMDLEYHIEAREEVYVGMINIIGNTKTKDKVIRREIRVYPGERYDGFMLRRSKERIYNLGYFEDVYFETVPTGEPGVKDLNVTVKEAKTGEFSFGGGYSSIDAFIGFAQIQQKNFDIMGFPTFTGAGQDLKIRAEIGSARNNYLLSWTDPWIFDFPVLFGFDVYQEEHEKYGLSGYGYDERLRGFGLRLGKEVSEYLYASAGYTLESVKISNVADNASAALRDEVGENTLSKISGRLSYDRRDNKFSPTSGYLGTFSLQNAGGFIGGDKDFLKGKLDGNVYFPIKEWAVLEFRGSLGLVKAYGDSDSVPIYERFFAGGAKTIRGYEERAVGPRDPGSGEAIGGEALALGTAELTFPIWKNLIKGAVFYDIGNVWAEAGDMISADFAEDNSFKMGAGVGVRVKTPIGPVTLDYGYPLSDNYEDKKEGQFYFSVSRGF